jgi:DUF971 family protein/molybdopterin converting factor small subunit
MADNAAKVTPTSINLHQKSRILNIEFSDGNAFQLPCEYLRVFSPATEVRHADTPVTDKEGVNIEGIEPQGQYAIRLIFDDGYDSGIYSWDTLYDLGRNQEQNWQIYLERLQQHGINRDSGPCETAGPRKIRILYFTYLVKGMGKEAEELELPDTVKDVQSLLEWLRKRLYAKAYLLQEGSLRVTVNKQFAEPFTRIEDRDEVALVPSSPYPPTASNER